jgi:aspartate carbamoyltransferase catalytic subunit
MKHLVSVNDVDKNLLKELFDRTRTFREKGIPKLYNGGDWVLMFLEPSTRTRMSFERALRHLGFETYLFSGEGSSLKKGESLLDTVLTLKAQGFEGFVIRTSLNGALEQLKELRDVFVVNAGDGTNEHPTQALIDAFTLWDVLGTEFVGLKILYVGDVAFSRVFRSGYKLFKKLGAEVGVCAPRSLKPVDLSALEVREFENIDEALKWCDVAVFLRIQKERQDKPLLTSERDYLKYYGLTPERAQYLRRHGKYYMHPGPVNRNVEIAASEVYGENSLILQQVKNGVYLRAALISMMKNPEG